MAAARCPAPLRRLTTELSCLTCGDRCEVADVLDEITFNALKCFHKLGGTGLDLLRYRLVF
jgi:hypothetical protein